MPSPTASFIYNQAGYEILDRSATDTLDLETVTLKIMLVNSTYSATDDDAHKDIELVDAAGTSDILDGEINATGYTGGYGGADRLTISTVTWGSGPDDTNNRVELDGGDVDWGTLGNGTNDTIVGAVLIVEDHVGAGTAGNDTQTRPVAYIDLADTTTNGSGFQIQWSTEGIIHYQH